MHRLYGCRRQGYSNYLAVEWSRERKKSVERMGFSRHLVRGVIATAIGPRALLGLELKCWHLSWMRMSPEPVQPVAGLRPTAVAD
jgi:hypothetical protein